MIEAKNLTRYYGSKPAIEDVTFTVEEGEVMGFLGPNGAGKTTTMRILTCFLSATSGTATIAGYDIFENSLEVRRLLHHRCRLSEDEPHIFGDQPEMWINHAGDRLFFRSNMCMKKGTSGQRYGHDLFFVRIPPRSPRHAPAKALNHE